MSTVSMQSSVSSHEWSWLRKFWTACKAYRTRRERYRAAQNLAGLSDHLLKDMGITRSDIYALSRGDAPDTIRYGGDGAA